MFQQALDGASVIAVTWGLIKYNYTAVSMYTDFYLVMLLILLGVLALTYDHFGIYRNNANFAMKAIVLFKAWTVTFLVLLAIAFLAKQSSVYSRTLITQIYLFGYLTQLVLHLTTRYVYQKFFLKNAHKEKVVIIGQCRLAHYLQHKISSNPWIGQEVVGFIPLPGDVGPRKGRKTDPEILGKIDDLVPLIEAHDIDTIYVVTPIISSAALEDIYNKVLDKHVSVHWIPDIFSLRLINHSLKEISGIPIITLSETPLVGVRLLAKEIEDKVLSALILLLISPLLIVLAIAVKLSSPGPIFFRQNRAGWNGKTFRIWKFRSMYVHQPEDGVVKQAEKNDSRITKVGAFIRKTSLDELPQLFNVLFGDMSLVGPRPHAIQHDEEYSQRIFDYFARHHIKPGITGLAQVRGLRGETKDIHQMIQRVESDIEYINNWSISLDISILLRTVFAFTGKSAY
jgi:putative colanic acid biosynthesis UDP-glucose lipid carrier transferase